MLQRRVRPPLRRQRRHVLRHPPLRQRRPVDHRHHAVDRHPAPHPRPLERLHQRLRQRQPARLDHDVIDPRLQRQDPVQRRHEVVRHRAADAAVGQLDDVLLRAALDPAALQDLPVDPDVAELVDDDREPPPAGVLQHVPDQRRLPRPEEPGDDGAGNAVAASSVMAAPSGCRDAGMRATSPRFSASGRARNGMNPSVEVAKSRAPATRSAPLAGPEPAEDVGSSSRSRKIAAVSPRLQLPRQATCRTATPVPAAARRASSASRLPGRGSPPARPRRRQDVHTSTRHLVRGAASAAGAASGTTESSGSSRRTPCPGRPAGRPELTRDGRSPGSRIAAPRPPSRGHPQWRLAGTLPPTVAGTAAALSPTHRVPSSPSRGDRHVRRSYGRPRRRSTAPRQRPRLCRQRAWPRSASEPSPLSLSASCTAATKGTAEPRTAPASRPTTQARPRRDARLRLFASGCAASAGGASNPVPPPGVVVTAEFALCGICAGG